LAQIYRPKSQLSTASSVLARSIREEERPPGLLPINSLLDSEHIYEEIRDQEEEEAEARMVAAAASRRPLPPLPPPTSDISGRPSPTRQLDSLGREKSAYELFFYVAKYFFVFFCFVPLYLFKKMLHKKWKFPSACVQKFFLDPV
jgi:hypothetical protein